MNGSLSHMKQSGDATPGEWSHYHGTSAGIHRLLLKQAWELVGPWKWKHTVTDSELSLRNQDGPDLQKALHDIRKGWSAHLFSSWSRTSRNHAVQCAGVRCNADRCAFARKMAKDAPARTNFLSGAFFSHAALASARGQDGTCQYCRNAVATTDHLLWFCGSLPGTRPCGRPKDELQARLAWPTGHSNDE